MSGQKYKRTNFEDDDNMSTGGTPPGVTYDPAIAFKAGATFWQKRSLLEKFLLFLVITLIIITIVLGALVGSRSAGNQTPKPAGGYSQGTSRTPSTSGPATTPPTPPQGEYTPVLWG